MIDYIKGDVAEITPTAVTLECHGIGYYVNISLNSYTAINNKSNTKLFIYEAIREDAHILYGFVEKLERELFLLLISVSGVGPNTARMILSSLPPKELQSVIALENTAMLKNVKGIGGKTAQRIIVDLKDKIKPVDDTLLNLSAPIINVVADEALTALVMLGFQQAASQKVITKLLKNSPNLKVEEVIKNALKLL